MSGPRGMGKAPGLEGARKNADRARDNWLALCAQDTGRPRPEWMERPETLPRKPPSRPKLPESGE